MRVLILGGTGLIGNRLARHLSASADVYASTRVTRGQMPALEQILEAKNWIFGFDSTDFQLVESEIRRLKPHVIVNCLGVIKHHVSSKDIENTVLLNSVLPIRLSSLAPKYEFKLIHFSTDCVFSGKTGNYVESSIPDPVDLYGRSKVLGELNNSQDLTIRTSFVGRELKSFTNLFEWVRKNQDQKVVGYKKAIYSGLTTQATSELIERLIFDFPTLTGLWHLASEPISKFDLIRKLSDLLNLNLDVEPDEKFACDRSLNSSALTTVTGVAAPDWKTMLDKYALDQDWYESFLKVKVGTK